MHRIDYSIEKNVFGKLTFDDCVIVIRNFEGSWEGRSHVIKNYCRKDKSFQKYITQRNETMSSATFRDLLYLILKVILIRVEWFLGPRSSKIVLFFLHSV